MLVFPKHLKTKEPYPISTEMNAEWFAKLGIALMALIALPFAFAILAILYILILLVRLANAFFNP